MTTITRRLLAVATFLIAGAGAASCGNSQAGPLPRSKILGVDATVRVVHLDLVASENGAFGGFNFDGYGDGEMTVRVPVGWRVDVTCLNASTTFTHSCNIIESGPITPTGGTVAFGAETPNPTQGLPIHGVARFSFVPTRPGRYRIACLVPGHEADGMWDWLVVTPAGHPAIATTSAPG